jgi:hypothetical protein
MTEQQGKGVLGLLWVIALILNSIYIAVSGDTTLENVLKVLHVVAALMFYFSSTRGKR